MTVNNDKPKRDPDAWPMVVILLGFFATAVALTYIIMNGGC